MNAYNEIDGIPCAASEELLTRILRDELGFEGIVVSDYYAVVMLRQNHFIAETKEDAAKLALRAGMDQELPEPDCMNEAFKDEIKSGGFPMDVINHGSTARAENQICAGIIREPLY